MTAHALRWLTGAGTAHLVYTISGHPKPITYDLATGRPVTACSSPPPFPLRPATAADPLCGECFETGAVDLDLETAQSAPIEPEMQIAGAQTPQIAVRRPTHAHRAIFPARVPSCSRTAPITNLSHPRRSTETGDQMPPGRYSTTLTASDHDPTTDHHHTTKGTP